MTTKEMFEEWENKPRVVESHVKAIPYHEMVANVDEMKLNLQKCEDEKSMIERDLKFDQYVRDDRWKLLSRRISSLTSSIYDYVSIMNAYSEGLHQDDQLYEMLQEDSSETRFDIHKGHDMMGAYQEDAYDEDDREMIKMIREMDICIIEEPLTCCNDVSLEDEDLTERLDRIVGEFDDDLRDMQRFDIWSHKEQGIQID